MGNAHTVNDVTAACGVPSLICALVSIALVAPRAATYAQSAPLCVHFGIAVSIADVLRSAWATAAFLPPSLDNGFAYSKTACDLVGILGQLGMLATVGWYGIVAVMTARLAYGRSTSAVKRSQGGHHVAVWGLAVVLTALPAVTRQIGRIGTDSNVCWIMGWNSGYRLTLLIPLAAALLLALGVLVFAAVQQSALEQSDPLVRLIPFNVIFLLCWAPMFANLLIEATSDEPASQTLRGVSLVAMSVGGVLNTARLLTTYPFSTACTSSRPGQVQQPMGMGNVTANVDSSFSDTEPLRLYYTRKGPGDEL